MASNINPNNIDGTYPVAGQDNNSQGFRDNFTNIKSNFQYAEDEITDLQNKVLLKAALDGTTLDNDMLGSLVFNGTIADFGATRLSLGDQTGSVTINYALGHFQTLTTTGSVSLAFSNFPAAGIAGVVNVSVYASSTAHTLTLPAAVSINKNGIVGINPTTNVITFPAIGWYTFQFVSSDGGSSFSVSQTNEVLQPLNSTTEDLGNGATVNLGVSDSYFSTSGVETGTLTAGVNGQTKVLAMYADGGDMTITCSPTSIAGWGGFGTITFSAQGQACTLKFINGRWFCIGNNGASFA